MRWLGFFAVTAIAAVFFLYIPSLFMVLWVSFLIYGSLVWINRSPKYAALFHKWSGSAVSWALRQYAVFLYGMIFVGYIILCQQVYEYARPVFWNDSVAYVDISHRSLLDEEFWITVRPFTIPLIYKFTDLSGEQVALRQWQIAAACWGIFAWAAVRTLHTRWLRFPAFAAILLFSLSLDITLWHKVVHSESLSMSLLVLMLAGWLLALEWLKNHLTPTFRQQILIGTGVSLLMVLWSFARDVHAYFVLGTGGILMLVMLAARRQTHHMRTAAGIVILSYVGIYLIQDATANAGQRWQAPLANILGQRILPDPERTLFMIEQGMPYTPEVQAFTQEWSYTQDYKSIFGDWLMEGSQAKRAYMRFLLSDPIAHLRETRDNRDWLFDRDLHWYAQIQETPIPDWQMKLTEIFYLKGKFLERLVYVAVGLLIGGGVLRLTDRRWLVPLTLLLLAVPIAFVVWHGDAMEMERH
ncbi:MAG: hypothetical protein K8I82_14120, partial [Anaerolineae bacterium]|nr:hypothetical protein [Anaerolineae bacterium]